MKRLFFTEGRAVGSVNELSDKLDAAIKIQDTDAIKVIGEIALVKAEHHGGTGLRDEFAGIYTQTEVILYGQTS